MFKLAAIGLDTSHAVGFTDLMQGGKKMVDGLRVTTCLRFPSAFQTEPDQDRRQSAMETFGVKVTRSLEEAVDGVDGILLEINDPALHLPYFERVADLGLPIFLDKPMADTLVNGEKIYRLAQSRGLSVWSASSLRFTPEIRACAKQVPDPLLCNVFGALGQAAKGSSVVWYGIHAFEMVATLMGRGAQAVFAREDQAGVVAVVDYAGGRRALVECNRDFNNYGGRAQNRAGLEQFVAVGSPYPGLIRALADFFLHGEIPVALKETLEIQAMLEAAEKSLSSGKTEEISA